MAGPCALARPNLSFRDRRSFVHLLWLHLQAGLALRDGLGRSATTLPNSEDDSNPCPLPNSKLRCAAGLARYGCRHRGVKARPRSRPSERPRLEEDRATAHARRLRKALRPCPHVACRHHLYLDVNPDTGTIKLNFPELEGAGSSTDSCALDVAERGPTSLDDISLLLNVTRERVRQIETQAMNKLGSVEDLHELRQVG